MELLTYWKEICLAVLGVVTVLSNISQKFRETITFWKTRKTESEKSSLEVKNSNLDYVQRYQAYMEDELKKLLQILEDEKKKFKNEISKADDLLLKSQENNQKSKVLIGRYRAHIKYLENLLSNNNVHYYKLEE